jgi:hypothetical protein
VDVSCPTVSQCTGVDPTGKEVTFNPTSPLPPKSVKVEFGGNALTRVSCPSASQCTAVDLVGSSAVSFNPNSPGSPARLALNVLAPQVLACPSVNQCTVVGDVQEVTFNPNSPGTLSPVVFDGRAEYSSVACPSISQCTVVYQYGYSGKIIRERTFNPTSHTMPGPGTIARYARRNPPRGVACPSVSQCTAIAGPDEITFNPRTLPRFAATHPHGKRHRR